MEDLGVSRVGERPIKLFRLANWAWVYPRRSPFILFVAAKASAEDELEIRRFAVDAVDAGCAYICAWGEGCEQVHDLFDVASIAADRFVMSTWHDDESLAEALWFALCNAWPDDDQFPNAAEATVILAVEEPWLAEVRELVADQEAFTKLVVNDEA
jgi:hypothetical protein